MAEDDPEEWIILQSQFEGNRLWNIRWTENSFCDFRTTTSTRVSAGWIPALNVNANNNEYAKSQGDCGASPSSSRSLEVDLKEM